MKHLYILLILSLIIISCNEKPQLPSSIQGLNSKKIILKTQIDSLSNQLKIVEKALSRLDTTRRVPAVTAFVAVKKDFSQFVEVQGVVKSDKNVKIHSEAGGIISHIYVKEGQQVRKGQKLAQLDASVINNSIAQAQTQLNLAITTFERQERLWSQKIGSEMQYLQTKAQKESLESNLNILHSQARKMTITAPFHGTIDEIFAKTGELASPQQPFLRIVNLKNVYLESEITETYLKDIKEGSLAIVSFPSLEKEITSKVTQVGNYINPNNRSFKTRINIQNLDNLIKPNLLADVKIINFTANGVTIPSYLLQKDVQNKYFVYILIKKDSVYTVQKTMILVEKEYNNESFISEGLAEGDLIVDKGARVIKNKDEVILVN